jgi:hypothetical protein
MFIGLKTKTTILRKYYGTNHKMVTKETIVNYNTSSFVMIKFKVTFSEICKYINFIYLKCASYLTAKQFFSFTS